MLIIHVATIERAKRDDNHTTQLYTIILSGQGILAATTWTNDFSGARLWLVLATILYNMP